MNTIQLQKILDHVGKNKSFYYGVFSIDKLPIIDSYPSCLIMNNQSSLINKKLLNTNRSYSTDTTSSSFASGSCGDEEGKMRALSALSASSSALSFEAISSSSVQIDSGHNYNHFSNQNLNQLSCSSNSLFRPMSRFVNHYGNLNFSDL